ncbi:MAG: hypothetical protein RIC55_21290 [Pirellulaceae bacterium]
MARDEVTIGGCPRCGNSAYACRYNFFESGDLQINSWEHRCPDCGHRETRAYRSDDEDDAALEGVDPTECCFCGRRGVRPD